MDKEDELINKKIGSLTVIEKTNCKSSDNKWLYKCICDCQNDIPIKSKKYVYRTSNTLKYKLNHNINATCGCRINSNYGYWNKRINEYDLSNEYGIGYTFKNEEFFFDKEDYDLIKNYSWHKHQDGYLRTCYDYYIDDKGKRHNKYIMLHQLIAQKYNMECKEIDHINSKPFDNRKENLRTSNHMLNMKNLKLYKNNTSGHKGVCYVKATNKWQAYIQYNHNRINLGSYFNYSEAVKVREEAEEKYFGIYNRSKENLIGDKNEI